MRLLLAAFAFILAGVGILGCIAVALDGAIDFGGTLPVLRAAGGVTSVGFIVLLVAVPWTALFFVIAITLLGSHE